MAIVYYKNGNVYIEPAVVNSIKSAIELTPPEGYGKTLLIDTGGGTGFGGGVGVKPVVTTQAIHVGNVDLSTTGADFTVSKTFTVNTVPVTLNAKCPTLISVADHINTQLLAVNITSVYAYVSGNFVGIASKTAGSTVNFVLGSGTALAVLGWTDATYTGTSTVGSGRTYRDFVYDFTSKTLMQNFNAGGLFYDLATMLYDSQGLERSGLSNCSQARAAETSKAMLVMSFSGNKLVQKTKYEGLCANGDITTVAGNLLKGFACKIVSGTSDPLKFKFVFYKGTYAGTDSNGFQLSVIGQKAAANAPRILVSSPEFANGSDFIAWTLTNEAYSQYFEVDKTLSDANFVPVAGDLTIHAGFNAFAGATETYNTGALNSVLAELENSNFDYIMTDKYGANGFDVENIAVQNFVNAKLGAKPRLVVGGHSTKETRGTENSSDSTTSAGIAISFNDPNVIVIHDGDKTRDNVTPTLYRSLSSLHMACRMVGLKAFLGAAFSLTFKKVETVQPSDVISNKNTDVDGNLGREELIQLGVMFRKVDSNVGTVYDKDINSLQSPDNLVYLTSNVKGESVSFQNISMSVKNELTKRIITYFTPLIIGKTNAELTISSLLSGFNTFMRNQVESRLIVDYSNLSVVREGVAYIFYYKFKEPTAIENVFFEGQASI